MRQTPAEYGRRITTLMRALGDTSPPAGSAHRTLMYNGFPPPTSAGYGGYRLEWRSADAPVSYRVEMGEGAHADVRLSSATAGSATVAVSLVPTTPAWRATYPSAGHRVLGAMRVWSTMRLFNPYQRLITESWDEQLRIALSAVERARDGVEYTRAIAAFAAHVHDTHVRLSGDAVRFVVPTIPVGVQARLIENQLVVTRAWRGLPSWRRDCACLTYICSPYKSDSTRRSHVRCHPPLPLRQEGQCRDRPAHPGAVRATHPQG